MCAGRGNYAAKRLTFAANFCKILGKGGAAMKVILKQDVKGTGKKGDILEVSDGYAKNFLLKKGLAEQASSVAVNSLKIQKEAEERRRREEIKATRELAQKMDKSTVTISIRCGDRQKEDPAQRPHQDGGRHRRRRAPDGGRDSQDLRQRGARIRRLGIDGQSALPARARPFRQKTNHTTAEGLAAWQAPRFLTEHNARARRPFRAGGAPRFFL